MPIYRNKTRFPILLAAGLLPGLLVALPVRIDLGMDTGRSDTARDGWLEWQVPNGTGAERQFGELTLELRSRDGFTGTWFKKGLAFDAAMATDGIASSGAGGNSIEVRISGLKEGSHSIVTYHNFVDDSSSGNVDIEIGDQAMRVQPPLKVKSDLQSASAYFEFSVENGQPVVVRISGTDTIILNGIEINGSDPMRKAFGPYPADGDLHADGDAGQVRLQWRKAAGTKSHRIYYATGNDLEDLREQVFAADPSSSLVRGTFPHETFVQNVETGNSLAWHAWRVDAIDTEGVVTRGDVWTFRTRQLAFPGAEGYGRFAIGGRGGRVIKVTNLNDSGPGSLRAAVEAEGPRTVVFDVSGRIVLEEKLVVRNPYLTIAGQTAPGKGICISNYNLGMLGTHDVIIRHMRVRPGDTSGDTLDGMGMASSDHCIIDHCSISWTHDEAFSSRGAGNITLQRTLISEALNEAGHRKYGKGARHGFAASISGDIGTFHHNLLAHCAGRNWSLAGGLDNASRHAGRLDIRNNVVYNWDYRTTDGGARQVNFVNNYYKPGPASRVFHVLKPERKLVEAFGPQDYFVMGNVMEGHYGPEEHWVGVAEEGDEPKQAYLVTTAFFPSFVNTQTAAEAYADVLDDVGANVPVLDEHDSRVIREVREGTVTYKGSRSGLPGLPDSQEDVGGWENYPEVHRPKGWDSDNDGIPDDWETARGLDPENGSDGAGDPDGDGFTNLEDYLNWLAAGGSMAETGEKQA
ncbi:MAG: polysaccharide lyase family 1 protein [Puniceicoccaceae bacterium]